MQKRQSVSTDPAELRRRAEDRIRARPETGQTRTEGDLERLVHELQVHQIELEMQNEELQEARTRLEALLAQYTDLYDFAPTGYFTLAADGTIRAVNLTGARLVGIERSRLLHRCLGSLVSDADRPAFKTFLEKTFAGMSGGSCEVALLRAQTDPVFVRIETVPSEGQQECRAAVLDITARHLAEVERERLIRELQTALARVKLLSGLLPICAACKRIRDDHGYWERVENYIQQHSEATFTHGMCPECIRKYYPGVDEPETGPSDEIPPQKKPPPHPPSD